MIDKAAFSATSQSLRQNRSCQVLQTQSGTQDSSNRIFTLQSACICLRKREREFEHIFERGAHTFNFACFCLKIYAL